MDVLQKKIWDKLSFLAQCLQQVVRNSASWLLDLTLFFIFINVMK